MKSLGSRIARTVKSTSTASVILPASKRSSISAGNGTTKTRMAPTIVTGRIAF